MSLFGRRLWQTPDHRLRGRGADFLALALVPAPAASLFLLTMLAVVAPELSEIVPLSSGQVGLLTLAFLVGGGAALVPTLATLRKVGGRVFGVGSFTGVVGSVVFALSSGFPGFLGGRFLQGVGSGILLSCALMLPDARVVPRLRRRTTTIVVCGAGVGVVLALFALPVLEVEGGYRAASLLGAGVVLVLGALPLAHPVVRMVPALPGGEQGESAAVARLGRMPSPSGLAGWLAVVSGVGAGAVVASLVVWTPSFLQDQRNLDLVTACYLTAFVGGGMILGALAGGALSARWRSAGTWATLGPATIALSAVPTPGATAGGVVLVVVSAFLATMAALALHLRVLSLGGGPGSERAGHSATDEGPSRGALPLALTALGAALAPWLVGWVLQGYGQAPRQIGYAVGFLILVVFGFVGTLASMVDGILLHRVKDRVGKR